MLMETKPSESEKVDAYMQEFKHPLKQVMESLREIIMKVDSEIGEEVKWNVPTFFYSGPMEPSDPKKYKRYLAVSNVFRNEFIMLVFPHGAGADDGSGFLEGEYKDGRRLIKFYSNEDVDTKRDTLEKTIKELLNLIHNS